MICTWRDHRPVVARCFLCGESVWTTAQLRGKIYCLACRRKRQKETARAANSRARQRRLRSKRLERRGTGIDEVIERSSGQDRAGMQAPRYDSQISGSLSS